MIHQGAGHLYHVVLGGSKPVLVGGVAAGVEGRVRAGCVVQNRGISRGVSGCVSNMRLVLLLSQQGTDSSAHPRTSCRLTFCTAAGC